MVEENQTIVKIGRESFSIVEIPSSGTVIVKEEKKRLLGSVDLPTLVTDLGRVGNFVRIAYNGVAGYPELQITIHDIGYNFTKLCDNSAMTVHKFKLASGSIIGDLQTTYEFLLDGLEDMALEILHSITDVAKDMAAAANQLHKDFDEESGRVETALKKMIKAKGSEETRKKPLEETVKELEVDKTKAMEEKKTTEDFELYEEKYKAAEQKQEAFESSSSNSLMAVANALVSLFSRGQQLFDTDTDYRQAQKAREEKLRYLEAMQKERKTRSKALQDIAEFTKKIENCKDASELIEVAIGALYSAMGGLQKLSATMMKAALFWKQMQVHCEQLAKEKMQRLVATALKMPEERRIRVWTSASFKTNAVKYCAQWVALDDICAVYMGKIQETQKDLYGYLAENPTLSEARENVRQLAISFSADLEREQQAIAQKESAGLEEMKQLEAEFKTD